MNSQSGSDSNKPRKRKRFRLAKLTRRLTSKSGTNDAASTYSATSEQPANKPAPSVSFIEPSEAERLRGSDWTTTTSSSIDKKSQPNVLRESILHNNRKAPVAQRLERTQLKKPWLCRTKFFKNMIDSSFQLVDQDGSNDVDEKELYSGLLLIHLKLGTYAGPAACKVSTVRCLSTCR
jgi:hypothetical protein